MYEVKSDKEKSQPESLPLKESYQAPSGEVSGIENEYEVVQTEQQRDARTAPVAVSHNIDVVDTEDLGFRSFRSSFKSISTRGSPM